MEEKMKHFLKQHYPKAYIVLLAGSTARGDDTNDSDWDFVIIDPTAMKSVRHSLIVNNQPVECFIFKDCREIPFYLEALSGIPFFTRMCAEGIIVIDHDDEGRRLKNKALHHFQLGPEPWSKEKMNDARYMITDLLTDLQGQHDSFEMICTATKLCEAMHEFILRSNRQWIGTGKWMIKSLRAFNGKIAAAFEQTFTAFFQTGDPALLVEFCNDRLNEYGGPLFDGFVALH